PASLPAALLSQTNYSAGLTAQGGSGVFTSWSVVGSLPAGLSLNSSSGLISGNVASNAVTQTFIVQVSDSKGATGTQQYTITVNATVVVSTTSLPDGVVKSAYTQTLTATGGLPPYSNWLISSGSPPPNVFLDPATGIISSISSSTGTVECPAGTFNFSV